MWNFSSTKGVGILAVLQVFAHLMPSFLVLTLPDRRNRRLDHRLRTTILRQRIGRDADCRPESHPPHSPRVAFCLTGIRADRVVGTVGATLEFDELEESGAESSSRSIVLALERGTFNEPIPKMMIYVPDGNPGEATTGIFVSDERNADDPRIIVAQQYEVIMDASTNQVALRLQHGVIHNSTGSGGSIRTRVLRQLRSEILAQSKRLLSHGGTSVLRCHYRPARTIHNGATRSALRRLTEYYKDLAFPTASLVFCLLRRPGRHRLETIRSNRRICCRCAGHYRLLHVKRRVRFPGHDGNPAALCRSLVTQRHFRSHHHRVVLCHESPVTPCPFFSAIFFVSTEKSSRCASARS